MKVRKGPARAGAVTGITALVTTLSIAQPAWTQEAAADAAAGTGTESSPESIQEVVVTGFRASLREALETKRQSAVMLDAVNAEDIADFPDANLAEALQRMPGISIDRDQGEGRKISVRGLPGDFTRVRINGLEALSTAGNNDAGTSPNRTRAFDFNTFASELFNELKVQKTTSAETDEGSLGATIDLSTARPYDYDENLQIGFSGEDSYYENGGFHNPKLAGLVSKRWETWGVLFSGAYSERKTEVDQYRRQAGPADYLYRNSDWAGGEAPQRSGFSAPEGTSFGTAISNPAAIAAQTGSDPTAYATLYPGAPYQTPGRFDDSIVRIPTLAAIEQSDVAYDRIGVTSSLQWRPRDDIRVNLDLLYSEYDYSSIIYQVSNVGLNRNNTNTTFNTATATNTTVAQRRALYPGACTFNDGTGTAPPQDCGQAMFGTTPAAGYTFSLNPNNLDPYEYYNNPNSPGFMVDPYGNGLAFRDALIGRPAVDVLDANVTDGVADYLVLRNVDMRSAADASFYNTTFEQASLDVTRDFGDTLTLNVVYGQSRSLNESDGQLVEFNSMDTAGEMTYDERGGGDMPAIVYGIDVADPSNWGIVKGFSAMRHFKRTVDNHYNGGRFDFDWKINDQISLGFGGNARRYKFLTQQRERNTDIINPTELEAGVTSADLGRVFDFGDGLDVPAGTVTQFFAPDLAAFDEVFGFSCSCINEFGDFRTIRRNSGRDDFQVQEDDYGLYVQLDFDTEMFGHRFFGNVGVRQAWTQLTSQGNSNGAGGLPITGENEYDDFLPSMNLGFEITKDLLMRLGAAKVMARPDLQNLAPTITAISVPSGPGVQTGATMTIGNPELNPYRGVNYDFSLEWYFGEGGLLSGAYFWKDIESFPQTVQYAAPLSEFMDEEGVAQVRAGFSNPNQLAYIDNDYPFVARQFRDAPGGELNGFEIAYQQDFTFLPGFAKFFGVQLNYTKIESELNYILDPGSATNPVQVTAVGPWLNASPEAFNATLYWENPTFSARVSVAQREEYFVTYPILGGVCGPGIQTPAAPPNDTNPNVAPIAYCGTPLINDFIGNLDTLNVDMAMRWNITEKLAVSLEGLNLTNQASQRFAYVENPVVSQYGSTGRQYTFGFRYRY